MPPEINALLKEAQNQNKTDASEGRSGKVRIPTNPDTNVSPEDRRMRGPIISGDPILQVGRGKYSRRLLAKRSDEATLKLLRKEREFPHIRGNSKMHSVRGHVNFNSCDGAWAISREIGGY